MSGRTYEKAKVVVAAAEAEERIKEHGGTAPGRPANTGGNFPQVSQRDGFGNPIAPPPPPPEPKTRDAVGAAVGMSGKTYEKAKVVVALGQL